MHLLFKEAEMKIATIAEFRNGQFTQTFSVSLQGPQYNNQGSSKSGQPLNASL